MQQHIYFLLLLSVVGITNAESGYTWEEYDGKVPKNGLLAGYGKNKAPIYIGKGRINNFIVPGKIYGNDSNVYFEYGTHAITSDLHVKILCTDNAQNFHWISTDKDAVLKLHNETNLVEGGDEFNQSTGRKYLTFIGRKYFDDVVEVGKIVCPSADICYEFSANRNGKGVAFSSGFEVLAYKSKDDVTE